MVFVWNENKNRLNRRKHGISFETAVRVFEDPHAVSYVDRITDGEERWHSIGLIAGTAVLLVVHLVGENNGEETIRIISARKASPRECHLYHASGET